LSILVTDGATVLRAAEVDVNEDRPLRVDLVAPAIRYRWWLLLGAIVGVLLALTYQLVATPRYTASVVLAPANTRQERSSTGLGGLSGLAGLAGGKLGGAEKVTSLERFKFLLTSNRLAQWQIQRRHVLFTLYPAQWDAVRRRWKPPTGFLATAIGAFKTLFGIPAWSPPDQFAVQSTYTKNLRQSKVGDTELVRVTYEDTDARRATMILKSIVDDCNEIVRQDSIEHARAEAAYIRQRLRLETLQEYRSTLLLILEEEEQSLMLASTNLPFVAETVENYSVSNVPTSKKPLTYAVGGGLLGGFLVYVLALFRFNRRQSPSLEN
jgi:uncharacterized protein involved in exopolysaccharide biosynthesis